MFFLGNGLVGAHRTTIKSTLYSVFREALSVNSSREMSCPLDVIGEFLISFDCGYNFDLLSHI